MRLEKSLGREIRESYQRWGVFSPLAGKRQFNNIKRVYTYLVERALPQWRPEHAILSVVDLIQTHFLLQPGLASEYADLFLLCYHRFDLDRSQLFFLEWRDLQEIVRILETHLLNQSEVYGVTFSSVMSDDLKSIKSEVATKGTQEAMCRCVMEFLWEQPEDAMLPRDPRERPVARIFSQEQQLGDMGEGGGLQFPKTVMVDAVDLASNSDPQTPATQHWDRCLHPLSHSEKLEVGHTIQEKFRDFLKPLLHILSILFRNKDKRELIFSIVRLSEPFSRAGFQAHHVWAFFLGLGASLRFVQPTAPQDSWIHFTQAVGTCLVLVYDRAIGASL